MPKAAMIRARTDEALKDKVEQIFQKVGLTTTSAINLFYHQVVLSNGIPFDVRIPNTTTRKAMEAATKGKTVKGFKDMGSMFADLAA